MSSAWIQQIRSEKASHIPTAGSSSPLANSGVHGFLLLGQVWIWRDLDLQSDVWDPDVQLCYRDGVHGMRSGCVAYWCSLGSLRRLEFLSGKVLPLLGIGVCVEFVLVRAYRAPDKGHGHELILQR
jgi:hypothetical protein